MPTKTKKVVTFPKVVAQMTAEELELLQQDEEQGQALIGRVPFPELIEKTQDLKREFWHRLYRDHKLDPQCAYHIDQDSGEILQMGPNHVPDAI